MDGLVSSASMIQPSLQPSPASETSAFNKIRAFSNRWAGLFPLRIRASSCSRSSGLNRTTYFFTEISFAAMIASVVITVDEANHQNLSNWLKLATRVFSRQDAYLSSTLLSRPAGSRGIRWPNRSGARRDNLRGDPSPLVVKGVSLRQLL